jgi:hypothetical protein
MTDQTPVFTAPDIAFPWFVALNRKHKKKLVLLKLFSVHIKIAIIHLLMYFGFILSMQTRF